MAMHAKIVEAYCANSDRNSVIWFPDPADYAHAVEACAIAAAKRREWERERSSARWRRACAGLMIAVLAILAWCSAGYAQTGPSWAIDVPAVTPSTFTAAGQTINFSFGIKNTGTVLITGLVGTTSASSLSCAGNSIAVGGTLNCSGTASSAPPTSPPRKAAPTNRFNVNFTATPAVGHAEPVGIHLYRDLSRVGRHTRWRLPRTATTSRPPARRSITPSPSPTRATSTSSSDISIRRGG